MDDGDVDSASLYVDAFNKLGLRLTFTPEGAQKLRRATSAEDKAEIGVVINGELVLHATVREPLEHEAVIVGGGLNREELNDWVTRLNAKARRRSLKKST